MEKENKLIERFEAQCGLTRELKTLGDPALARLPHFCEFDLQKPNRMIAMKVREKPTPVSRRWRGKIVILKSSQNILYIPRPVLRETTSPEHE